MAESKRSVLIRSAYDGVRMRTQLDTSTEPSLTVQSEKKNCDINVIMARYEKTGVIEHVAKSRAEFGDFSEVVDFHSAMNQVALVRERFADLPSRIRRAFENDPAMFLAALDDPARQDELVELGVLAPPEPAPDAPGSPPVSEPPAAAPEAGGD